jgi:hypothetical protein
VNAQRQFADVEYLEAAYFDAELIGGAWLFENAFGAMQRFHVQDWVHLLSKPHHLRQHPAGEAGHAGHVSAYKSST